MNEPASDRQCPECSAATLPATPAAVWQDGDEELAVLAKALGHPARVRIIRFLQAQGEDKCVCGNICEQIPLAQSTVSQHLKMLKQAGLIRGEVDGPRICYTIARERLERLRELMQGL